MANTYHEQSDWNPKTISLRELIAQLQALPAEALELPAIFKSPENGCYGPRTAYTIDAVSVVHLPERRENFGPQYDYDDDTGERVKISDEYEEVWHAWSGVVIG